MISVATLVMFAWMPLIALLFSLFPPRRAVIAAYVVGWMFLPVLTYNLPGLPAYDKGTATNLGVLLASLLFDRQSLLRFRISAADLPVLILCLCPIASSLSNDLGLYDGLSTAWGQLVGWGVPWFIGRCYFGSLAALRDLAVGMFLGGITYMPFCFIEMRFGAILHSTVYGYLQHDPYQTMRGDGWIRPMVFMQHGLMLAMWMGSSALAGLAVSRVAVLPWLPRAARTLLVVGLVATTLLCRSVGASALMLAGIAVWFGVRRTRVVLPMVLLVAAVPAYMALRVAGMLDGADLTGAISSGLESTGFSPTEAAARMESARARFAAEDQLLQKARQQPVFGVGNWGFNQYVDPETGELRSITTDGLWIILLTTRGVTGLAAWMTMMLLPVLIFLRRNPLDKWRVPLVATTAMLSLIVVLHALDCLLNTMVIPIFILIAGGLVGVPAVQVMTRSETARRPQRPAASARASTGTSAV